MNNFRENRPTKTHDSPTRRPRSPFNTKCISNLKRLMILEKRDIDPDTPKKSQHKTLMNIKTATSMEEI